MSLVGQTAVVTGGTRGLGAAMTRAFLAAGARVHATYHSNDDAANAFGAGADADGRLIESNDPTPASAWLMAPRTSAGVGQWGAPPPPLLRPARGQ